MDDPGIGNRVKGSRRAMRRLFALAAGALGRHAAIGEQVPKSRVRLVSVATRLASSSARLKASLAAARAASAVCHPKPREIVFTASIDCRSHNRFPKPTALRRSRRKTIGEASVQLASLQESSAGDPDASEKDKDSKDVKRCKRRAQERRPRANDVRPQARESTPCSSCGRRTCCLRPVPGRPTRDLFTRFSTTTFPVPIFDPVTGDMIDVVEGQVRRRLLYSPLAVRYGLD